MHTKITGLSEAQAEQSRRSHGSNSLTRRKKDGFVKKYLHSFGDPMIKVLLVALGINIVVMFRSMEWFEPLGIAVSILIATLISTLSEFGSESAFERLSEDASKIKCKVRRDGQIREIPIDLIVAGDVVLLQTGDRVPADGIVIDGTVHVDQSSLNGETKEKEKFFDNAGTAKFSGNFMSSSDLFRGTVVCQGECEMEVKNVGDKTFYGQMAREIQEDTRESPLNLRLTQLAGTVSKMGYTGAVLVGLAYIFQIYCVDFGFNLTAMAAHYSDITILFTDILNLITLVVTVIVVAVPEGLPMMITVVLSANIRKMLKDNVLVRKMTGIETAGSMNILFTDKTGTLTQGKLLIHTVITGDNKRYSDKTALKKKSELYRILCASCVINNGAEITRDKGLNRAIGGNATDRAVLEYFKNDTGLCKKIHRTSSIPFSSTEKFSCACTDGEIKAALFKGSPDLLLPLCTHYLDENGIKKECSDFSKIREGMNELSKKSVRLLAVTVSEERPGKKLPENMTLVAVLGLRDDLRPESPGSVRRMREAGIQVVMITGDSRETATAIANECGITGGGDDLILTSKELSAMSDEEICKRLPRLRVVARALPSDKSRLVKLAQSKGLVVGMTGDGVNDAPALKAADVGFSMGSGTEVAKEASDIVILDDNIKSISKAVLYGRTIFKSIRKFIIYQLTINLSAMGLSIIGPIIGIDTPITVMQMLWINLVMDTLAGIAFSGECPKESYMREKPKRRDEPILNNYMLKSIFCTGLYSLMISLLFCKLPFFNTWVRQENLLTAFFALFMFMAIFNSFNCRTHKLNLMSYLSKNKPFLVIIGLVFLSQIIMIYAGGIMFRTSDLTFGELIRILLLASTIIPFDLIRKQIQNKKGTLTGV